MVDCCVGTVGPPAVAAQSPVVITVIKYSFATSQKSEVQLLAVMLGPPIVDAEVALQFPIMVIEVPKQSYHSQTKAAMSVASKKQGGSRYDGPQRVCPLRWLHIHTFYIVELSNNNYYQAKSLTNHPHYSILRSELPEYEEHLRHFQTKERCIHVKRIHLKDNYYDNFLLVINNLEAYPLLVPLIHNIDDTNLLMEVSKNGKLDHYRGNMKLDFGFACGQNLERHRDDFGSTTPRILDRTKEPTFLEIQKELSEITNAISETFNLPKYHCVDDIHLQFAATLHPEGIYPAWRAAWHGPNRFIDVHEDAMNDSRPLMSPVGVLSRIYQTKDGPLRLTKIGYSRKSLRDSLIRHALIEPVVRRFKEWETEQSPLASEVTSDLLELPPNSQIEGVVEIPCHLERSVGLSPYIYAVIKLQKMMRLSREQCVAITYNCITNESPFYFYEVFQNSLTMSDSEIEDKRRLSAVEIGLWYHDQMWSLIETKKINNDNRVVPRRHQPHNGVRTTHIRIKQSLINLLELTAQLNALDEENIQKQFHHSKSIAILMLSPDKGGCHACGSLTSQNLLYTLACLGLVPIGLSRWGELAATDTAGFLEREYQLCYAEGRAEQFFRCCLSCSPGHTPEQIENRLCKWTRWEKYTLKYGADANVRMVFRDAIFPKQYLYQPVDGHLIVVTRGGRKLVAPPASNWPSCNIATPKEDSIYWNIGTRDSKKRVLGVNRVRKKMKVAVKLEFTWTEIADILPSPHVLLYQNACTPLCLSINNLLGTALGEPHPVPNERIILKRRKKNQGFTFGVKDETGVIHFLLPPDLAFGFQHECKVFGSILFAEQKDKSALTKYVFGLLDSPAARVQISERSPILDKDYYIIHDNNRRALCKRSNAGIVKKLNDTTVVLVLMNEHYRDEKMTYIILHK